MMVEANYPAANGTGVDGAPMPDFPFSPAGQAAWVREQLRFASNRPNIASWHYFYPDMASDLIGSDPGAVPFAPTSLFETSTNPRPALAEFRVNLALPPNTVQFVSPAYGVNENASSVTVAVGRTGDVTTAVSVSYTTLPYSATSPSDFAATTGTLSWAAGDGFAKFITVPIVDDVIAEPNKTFDIVLFNPSGASVGIGNVTTVTILDDESATVRMPGNAAIVGNPYGLLSVSGGTLAGTTLSNFQKNAVIQLGSVAGSSGSFVELDFQGLNIGAGNALVIRSGAQGQSVVLRNADSTASSIQGLLQAQGANGAPPPMLVIKNQNGISVNAGGRIGGPAGLAIDALGSTWNSGQSIVNAGTIDGGTSLELLGAKVNGSGAFKGDGIAIRTFGNANNPVNGSHFLSNGLQLFPSTGGIVQLTVNTYGNAPQFINLMVNGNAMVSMPSAWPSGSTAPPNSAPLPAGAVRPAGAPEPSYGSGSIILQAAGSMTLLGGGSNDLVFPGGLVLKAGVTLNFNGVTVNQGWTTTGKPFQGIYFESPNITSPTLVSILSNDLNWTNFSTLPAAHFRISRLVLMPDGTARYSPADTVAPHQNVYSILIETVAAGGCWLCIINSAPIDVH